MDLKKRQKEHARKNSGMSPFSYITPNVGEESTDKFNSAISTDIGNCSMAEDLVKENKMNKYRIEFYEIISADKHPLDTQYVDIEAENMDEASEKFFTEYDKDIYEISGIEEYIKDNPLKKSLGEWVDDDFDLDIYDDELSDEEADIEHANIYGGDTMYCRKCYSKLRFDDDGYTYCPECNPDRELNEVAPALLALGAAAATGLGQGVGDHLGAKLFGEAMDGYIKTYEDEEIGEKLSDRIRAKLKAKHEEMEKPLTEAYEDMLEPMLNEVAQYMQSVDRAIPGNWSVKDWAEVLEDIRYFPDERFELADVMIGSEIFDMSSDEEVRLRNNLIKAMIEWSKYHYPEIDTDDLENSLTEATYPNGVEVPETSVDMDKALDYMYGEDRDSDNSHYTDEEKQKAITYWIEKTDPKPSDVKEEVEDTQDSPYNYEQTEEDLRSLTQNWTVEADALKTTYQEEYDFGLEILAKHYNNVEGTKRGNWYEITFSDLIK